ncbi:hypothetical protein [Actinoplanes sp. L3-i22]|uniref:hypothetical protein n=1 Tax=Actinoplanes sp. L3-i22 TaxID=2836373 RepID=UPI001C77EAC3|nr:hypothetical protein [Actinoplanes sp. L3-i22]BCY09869.1 hypothetical protein L3i22_049570 [Actinoplanes sp. L3-i22]
MDEATRVTIVVGDDGADEQRLDEATRLPRREPVAVPDAMETFFDDGDNSFPAVFLLAAWTFLTVMAAVVTVVRRRARPFSPAPALGALSTAVTLAAPGWILVQGPTDAQRVAHATMLVVAVLIVLLLDDDRPVPVAAARLSLLAMLLLQVPADPAVSRTVSAWPFVLATIAAVLAAGALYAGRKEVVTP